MGALGRLEYWLPALPMPPPPARSLIMDSSCPQAPPRTAPLGVTARQPQLSVTSSNPGNFFLVQPLEPFHGSLTHITERSGKLIFYFLGPCSRISTIRRSKKIFCVTNGKGKRKKKGTKSVQTFEKSLSYDVWYIRLNRQR